MSNGIDKWMSKETKLIRFYIEITGATESIARGVFIYICSRENEDASRNGKSPEGLRDEPLSNSFARERLSPPELLKKVVPIPIPG